MRRYLLLIFVIALFSTVTFAQNLPNHAVLFKFNGQYMAQSLIDESLMYMERVPASDGINVQTYEDSPLEAPPADGYGFYQGILTPTFVYTAINGPHYRVISQDDGILIEDTITPEQGYLVPVGFNDSGQLILLERYMLHNLKEVRIWEYDGGLTLLGTGPIGNLTGNTASFYGGWVFIGFDTVGMLGYLFNINTLELNTFRTAFALEDPPASAFEHYPVEVMGIIELSQTGGEVKADVLEPTPFLHWPLPDYARSITCYPDSEWTDLNFPLECPGLAEPRAYVGHEGTDIGGKPNGLSEGTSVYAATQGVVIDTYAECVGDDINCGGGYGNYVLMEHVLVKGGNVDVWYTGYAHLQTVLVEPYAYIQEIGVPIALSGATGFGGAHLHIEVRSLTFNVVNPFIGLWIGDNNFPTSSIDAFPPPALLTCTTLTGNNIRTGPGLAYESIGKSEANTSYEVFQIENIIYDEAPGDWYHIRWTGGEGWLYADLMQSCTEGG